MATRKEISIIRANDGNFVVTTTENGDLNMQVAVGVSALCDVVKLLVSDKPAVSNQENKTLN